MDIARHHVERVQRQNLRPSPANPSSATNPQRRVGTAGQCSSSPFGLVDIAVNAISDYNLQARTEP
ncbi:hypothetical protein [Dactylosporangium sp. NPDC051484]|uniref:hypothetical protein n=1 Tax=Dactylosporangium sp. NPDC051484 TaxID=3154942 RepID=UPI00344BB57B